MKKVFLTYMKLVIFISFAFIIIIGCGEGGKGKKDMDIDGIADSFDDCPETSTDETAYYNGCSPVQLRSVNPNYKNSLDMSFNLIPAGTFTMGSPLDEDGRFSDETEHQVTLTQEFYLQTTEITVGQWEAVMGILPSGVSNSQANPVCNVSWNDVQAFIAAINTLDEGTYRLPTESEWEYAARAGSTTAYANGDTEADLALISWVFGINRVSLKDPNAWGIYDVNGNVWEWCQDRFGNYPTGRVTDPVGSETGQHRVFRGGNGSPANCRSARRYGNVPGLTSHTLGFRLARNP